MAMNDSHLIRRAIDGDEAAQQALYESHYVAAFRLVWLFLRDTLDAEEVVQDGFAYLFRNLHRYDGDQSPFWAWLRLILVSRCRNKRRRRQLALVSLDKMESAGRSLVDRDTHGDPVRALELQSKQQVLWEALRQISTGAREAIVLRYYEGMPYADIARALGCSPQAARARVAHGKLQLRRLLAGPEPRPARSPGVGTASEARST